MKILVLGGRGFIGSNVVAALQNKNIEVCIASRYQIANASTQHVQIKMQTMQSAVQWLDVLAGYEVVINTVGILRERWGETYNAIHTQAPKALAEACKINNIRLIHISALGLSNQARSRFIRSKLAGEAALLQSGADVAILRPSLLDGNNGYGAKWIRRVAQWPIIATMQSKGRIAPLDVEELGEAIANLCLMPNLPAKVIELGGEKPLSMAQYLLQLRAKNLNSPLMLEAPRWLVRIASHMLDAFYLTPLSFGHMELMQSDNVPNNNQLAALLGRKPKEIKANGGWVVGLGVERKVVGLK